MKLGDVSYMDSLYDDSSLGRQVPTGVTVLRRIHKLVKDGNSKPVAYRITPEELSDVWINALDIYPKRKDYIPKLLKQIYETKPKTKHQKASPGFRALLDYPVSSRNENYFNNVNEFNERMRSGFDIKADDKDRISKLETENGVRMTEDELRLHEDNYRRKNCPCDLNAVVKFAKCPRQMISSGRVDKSWRKWKERKIRDALTGINQRKKLAAYNKSTSQEDFDFSDDDDDDEPPGKNVDGTYNAPAGFVSKSSGDSRVLRGKTKDNCEVTDSSNEFPQIPLWLSRGVPNPAVMKTLVHCVSEYKISERDVEELLVDVGRMVFKQKWVKSTDENFVESTCEENTDDDNYEAPKKKKRRQRDADFGRIGVSHLEKLEGSG